MEAYKARAAGAKDAAAAQQTLANNPNIGDITVDKFTPTSVEQFRQSGKYADLEPVGSGTDPQLDALFAKWKADPKSLSATEMSQLVARAKDKWGAEYTNSVFNESAGRTADQKEVDELLKLQTMPQRSPQDEDRLRILQAKHDPSYTKLTDEQSKTLYFDSKARNAYSIAESRWKDVLEGKKEPPVRINEVVSAINQWFLANPTQPLSQQAAFNLLNLKDPIQQQYLADMLAIAYPALRKETGAAISQQEWQTAFNLLIPFQGETPAGRANKVSRLRSDMDSLNRLARMIPAYDRYTKMEQKATPKPETPKVEAPAVKKGATLKWGDL
jgi:hypothetical protein